MSDANWLWPIDGKSFYDINNNNYLVHIDWSKNSKEDYQKLSQDFFECGYKICEKIVDSGHDNIKSDMWFFPTMYLFRHGMELGLKALICGAISEKYNRYFLIVSMICICCSMHTKERQQYCLRKKNMGG